MPLKKDTYKDTVNYLYALQYHGIKLGLDNPLKLSSLLGNCHSSFRSVHIAGTNGKGSTASMTASILKECGYRVGLYTSPHLSSFTERIRVNGAAISESEVIRLASHIRKIIAEDNLNPTFFEFVTALAFYYFANREIDVAVVETGMGGRLDATNVLNPDVSIITSIGLDHNEFLGDTISDIAFEKAGIIKHSVPVVTAVSNKEALDVLKRTAEDRHAEIHIYGTDFNDAPLLMDCDHIAFDYSGFSRYSGLFVPVTGRHQIQNASLAVRACEILSRRGLSVTDDAIFRGLKNLQLEGRLETVSVKPHIIIDGAHNPEAAQALSQSMTITYPSKKIILVVGIMKDKDIMGILKPLIRIADSVILTRPDSDRAAAPEAMKEGLERIDIDRDTNSMCSISTSNTLSDAVSTAKNMCRDDSIILVTGSFYTAGEAKDILNHKSGVLSRLREKYSSGNSN